MSRNTPARDKFLALLAKYPLGAGRVPGEVNDLAEEGVIMVLLHDMSVIEAYVSDDKERPSEEAVEKSLNRLARIGQRTVTSKEQTEVTHPIIEPYILELVEKVRELSKKDTSELKVIEAEIKELPSGDEQTHSCDEQTHKCEDE